jgi:saccharopine dehydrogenase (NAD+, L-lysine forming)
MAQVKIGIIREMKTPPDSRVVLTPAQCALLKQRYPQLDITVQQSPGRCYSDAEYTAAGVTLVDDMTDRDILIGVKEVPIDAILPNKTYLCFSHTHKKQAYNRPLLQAFMAKDVKLVDYEVLTDHNRNRVIAFGHFAGLVGAHNGLLTWGKRTGKLNLQRVKDYKDFAALTEEYKSVTTPPIKIVLTGGGRVAQGAKEILDLLRIKEISKEEYLKIDEPTEAVYVQLNTHDIYQHKAGQPFYFEHFKENPEDYVSVFAPFAHSTDLLINAIFWDPKAPRYFSLEEMADPKFKITTIADITCDIGGSVPATLRATTIAEPFIGYDPITQQETAPFQTNSIDIMSIDNLPNELPRDASQAFGEMFIEHVLEGLISNPQSDMIARATICENGHLGREFGYLEGFVGG